MILRILAVGKLRESYWHDGISDYLRRLRPYARIEIVEIPDVRIPENASPAEEEKAMAQEGEVILARLKGHAGPIVVLDRQGKAMGSLELAEWIRKQIFDGQSEIAWVIGGPLGVASSVTTRANLILSFSMLTFPHQMMRLILLEQIYRSFRIMHHEPYHK